MSKYICIVLAALMVAGCFRSEVREARRERAPLREVFPPPSVEAERTASAAPRAPETAGMPAADAGAASDSEGGATSLAAPALDERPSAGAGASEPPAALPGMENEFIEARAAVE
jgi:hypothetical protein